MGILSDILNIPEPCSGAEAPMLGDNIGCFIEDGNTDGVGVIRKGTRWPKNTVFNEAFWKLQIQLGVCMPLPGGYEVEFTPSEDSYTTSNTGIKSLDILGLPEFNVKYKRDVNFEIALAKLQSFGAYEVVLFDDRNTLGVVDYGVDGVGGYTCGHMTPGMSGIKTPGNVKVKSLMFQLIDRLQWDQDRRQIVFSNHGIKFKKHTGISPFIVSYPAVPAAGTSVQVKITLADGSPATGLAPGNLRVIINGVGTNITVGTEVAATGVYDLTTPAIVADDEITITTWDATLEVPNIVYGAFIHRGSANIVVV